MIYKKIFRLVKKIFVIIFFASILIPLYKSIKSNVKAYNSSVKYYDNIIDSIDTMIVSINIIYNKSGVKVETDLNDKNVVNKIKYSISNSTQEFRDQRIFDYMGTMSLRSKERDKIRISFKFDHNSDVIWFIVYPSGETFGIEYKYTDTEMYWYQLLTGVIELNTQ